MFKFISMQEFWQHLFDRPKLAEKASTILEALLEARSPRLSDLSHRMPGSPSANYKALQRFLAHADPMTALQRLFCANAPFVLGDTTEIPRPQVANTPYMGWLKDGKTRGFSLLVLATPFRGRAIPFSFVSYSSETIQRQASSRNLEHARAFRQVKDLLGDKPLVLDREFSYQGLFEALSAEGVSFVIRLKLGRHPPHLMNEDSRPVDLVLQPGKRKVYRGLYHRGKVEVNLAGEWKKGLGEPLWVITNLEPEEALSIYQNRMKIEESFRDLKSLLCLDKLMNKRQVYMEKMVAMLMIAYSVGLLIGEAMRDHLYPQAGPKRKGRRGRRKRRKPGPQNGSSKRSLYSGLFILLKHKLKLPIEALQEIVRSVLAFFAQLVSGIVRTQV